MRPEEPTFLEISDAIYAVLKEVATEEQTAIFNQWLGTCETNRQLFEKFRSEQALVRKYDAYEKIDIARNQQKFRKSLARRKRIRIMRNCAAIILPVVLIAGIWAYVGRHDVDAGRNTITRVMQDVVLIMPDGSRVVMDSSTDNSRVAEQEGIALIRRNGELVHEKQDGNPAVSSELRWGTVEVPKGKMFNVVLEDGTRVWLNADSHMRFPLAFNGDERRVYLEGEAYFDVTADAKKPFIVETQEQTLQVLGTEFNIYAYPQESSTYTSLVAGRISLASKTTHATILLAPGQQARLERTANAFEEQNIDPKTVGLWRQDLFAFSGNTLEKIFRELARWYGFEYHFEDSNAAGLILMGEIPRYDDIDRVFRQIETLGEVRIEIRKNVVVVKTRK